MEPRQDGVRAVTVRDCTIGGPDLVVMAGPCAVESPDQIFRAAEVVAASGARFLRGGAFKVRTSPASFQGLGWDGCPGRQPQHAERPAAAGARPLGDAGAAQARVRLHHRRVASRSTWRRCRSRSGGSAFP
jgi:hypothetical protein